MSTIETLESLQEALAPLEILQNDQAELGSWIHDSFAALEKLHSELTQWQSELARKETELDLRQDALGRDKAGDKYLQNQVVELERELESAKNDVRQLEEENGEQLREFESLGVRFAALEVENGVAKDRIKELELTLHTERQRISVSCEQWNEQFKELRENIETYYFQLAEQIERVVVDGRNVRGAYTPLSAGAARAKSAELRRRAQFRREAKERRDPQADNHD